MIHIGKKILSIVLLSLLVFGILSVFCGQLFRVSAQATGNLTGVISDDGVDTDIDGKFNFLDVGVEVNVTGAGFFAVEVSGLYDSAYNYIGVWGNNFTYLDVGVQFVHVFLDGPSIYGSGFNPISVSDIYLYDEYYTQLDYLFDVSLLREYDYTEFNPPPARLTGVISDGGVDTDIDGKFDFLDVGVEVNVSTAGIFAVEVSGLYDSAYNYIGVWGNNFTYLDVGVQFVHVFLDGPSIYGSGFNPISVSDIYLYDEYYTQLDYLFDVSLLREYDYTEFNLPSPPPPPPARLTGVISDGGVDTDIDGKFDFLDVGVQVNVTEAGQYVIVVSGLRGSSSGYINIWDDESEYLDVGVQVINVSLYGPAVHASGVNPVNISQISLFSVEYFPPFAYMNIWIESLYNVPLSSEYSYTDFDSSFNDIEVTFAVYPDGRVVMNGAMNYDPMESLYTGPPMYGNANIKKNGDLTVASANFTLIIPADVTEASVFPYNSSAFTLNAEYVNDLLTATVDGSTVLPSSITSEFPFNATSFIVKADYIGDAITGNATVDILPDFPLEDVNIDFYGNNTYIYLIGTSTVIYGSYPGYGEINSTILDDLLHQLNSTIPGQETGSLYNMTKGHLECTSLNTTVTPFNAIGGTVDFEAEFQGDLIQTFVNMTAATPPMYEVLNSTWSSIESGSLILTYSREFKEADMHLVFTVNATALIDSMTQILPEIPDISHEVLSLVESILNTTYCNVESAQILLKYESGQVALTATITLRNDFNAEINYIKEMYLTFGLPQPLTEQLQILNETRIDLTDFSIDLNLAESSLEIEASGFAALPPLDDQNTTSFKLARFFNVTSNPDEPPREGEQLRVIVEGRHNTTHTIKIIRSGTVPEPDTSTPVQMTWNNQSISGLRDLIFRIEHLDDVPPLIETPIHSPEDPDDEESVTVSVNVTDAYPGVRGDGVILSYSTDGGGTWNNITMSKSAGDTYNGVIPGLPAGTEVKYVIIAYDYADNVAVEDKAGDYYVYKVIPEYLNLQIVLLVLVLVGTMIALLKRQRISAFLE